MFVCVCAVCFRQPDKKLGVKVLIFWVLRASDWQDMQILYNNVWETTAGGGFGSFIGAPWSVSFDAVSPRRWHLFNSNSTPEPPTLMSWHGIPPLFRFSGLAPSGMGIGIATLRLAGVCYGMESKWTVMVWRAQASRIYVIFNFSLQKLAVGVQFELPDNKHIYLYCPAVRPQCELSWSYRPDEALQLPWNGSDWEEWGWYPSPPVNQIKLTAPNGKKHLDTWLSI